MKRFRFPPTPTLALILVFLTGALSLGLDGGQAQAALTFPPFSGNRAQSDWYERRELSGWIERSNPAFTGNAAPQPEATFGDVPGDHWAYGYIQRLYQDGFIAGCQAEPRMFCPQDRLTRAEMAVLVERGVHGGGYAPPAPTRVAFEDVPLSEWFTKWVNELYADGYTAGCSLVPRLFCPAREHTRAESTVFFERVLHGVSFDPPQPTAQVYEDVPVGPNAPWFSKWIGAAYADAIVQECEDEANRGDAFFRPEEGLTRAEAACMLYMVRYVAGLRPTAMPSPTAAPTPSPAPPPLGGIWISAGEVAELPMSGPAWERLEAAALAPFEDVPDLSARNREQVQAVARALYWVRTGDTGRREEVREALATVMGTEGGDTLATCRALGAWVIAADLIDLGSMDPSLDAEFRTWLRRFLDPDYVIGTRSLVRTHEVEKGGNNWGTAAGFSRAAIALYLDDPVETDKVARVFQGYLGHDGARLAPSNFRDLSWQCDPDDPVGINPKGCTKDGHSIDGVLPDDQRRGGSFAWPPPKENYVYTGLQGVLPQAVLLYRGGYDVWNWGDQAILRAYEWLYEQADFRPPSDDAWTAWLVDYHYRTDGRFSAGLSEFSTGKTMDWTDWTHGGGG